MNEVNNNFMQYKHPCKNLIKMFNKKFDIFSFQNLTRVSLFEYKSVWKGHMLSAEELHVPKGCHSDGYCIMCFQVLDLTKAAAGIEKAIELC